MNYLDAPANTPHLEPVSREGLARRRELWRAYRERGELPALPAPERIAAARRHRRTYWWTDAWEEEEEGRPPPEEAPGPVVAGPATARWRGSRRHGSTTQPTGEAVAV